MEDPFDMGWRHGTEDIHVQFKYRPDRSLSKDDFEEYKDGYREAHKGWDNYD